MTCLSQQQIVELSLGESDRAIVDDHLAACPTCRSEVDSMQSLVGRLADWHASFDRGHREARERLLDQLPAAGARSVKRVDVAKPIPRWFGETSVGQRIAMAVFAVAAVIAVVVASCLITTGHLSAMEQMASQIRKIQSVSYCISEVGPKNPSAAVTPQIVYWQAPGSTRTESTYEEGKVYSVVIHPAGKPGIEFNLLAKTYQRLPAKLGSEVDTKDDWVANLGRLSGPADRDLGTKEIDRRPAQGFFIADSNDSGVTVEAWIDAESKLPIVVDLRWKAFGHTVHARMDEFVWNADLDPQLFAAEPPAGYADSTPQPLPLAEQCRSITAGLEFYAAVSGGYYPPAEQIQAYAVIDQINSLIEDPEFAEGDTPRGEIMAGIAQLMELLWMFEHQMCQTRVMEFAKTHLNDDAPYAGITLMQEIQENHPDAAYHGLTVWPRDNDKVLFRWKLEDGQYQVIYGDLHFETVSVQRLRELEGEIEPSGREMADPPATAGE